MSNEATIVFTRHANSCNNFKDKKKGSFLGIKMADHLHKDIEPGLTVYGIISGIMRSNTIEYTSNVIFVSRLVRTWMTAILLYLPHIPEKGTLNLIVSPFLTEVIKDLNKIVSSGSGNKPIIFKQELYKILYFLEFLYNFQMNLDLDPSFFNKKIEILFVKNESDDSIIIDLTVFKTKSATEYFNETFNKVSNPLNNILTNKEDSLIDYNSSNNYCLKKDDCKSIGSDRKQKKCDQGLNQYIEFIYSKLLKSNIITINSVVESVHSTLDISAIKEKIKLYSGSISDFDIWDLNRFINEFIRDISLNNKTYICVAHSNVMKDLINTTTNIQTRDKDIYDIAKEHNMWSIVVKKNYGINGIGEQPLTISNIYTGISKSPKEYGINPDKDLKSACENMCQFNINLGDRSTKKLITKPLTKPYSDTDSDTESGPSDEAEQPIGGKRRKRTTRKKLHKKLNKKHRKRTTRKKSTKKYTHKKLKKRNRKKTRKLTRKI